MGKQRILQNKKNRDVFEGFGIDKKDLNRAVQEDFVIDVNKKTSKNITPKFTG